MLACFKSELQTDTYLFETSVNVGGSSLIEKSKNLDNWNMIKHISRTYGIWDRLNRNVDYGKTTIES